MLPADQRLRANREFRLVYARGRSYVHSLAVLYLMHRKDSALDVGRRIGFVVSKKQGGAVVRNRIKRRLREAVRLQLPEMREGPFDMAFVGRSKLKDASWPEIQAAVADLVRRAGLRKRSARGGEA